MNRCENCPYNYWDSNDEGESVGYAHCHFTGPDGWAPCEQDDDGEED